MFVGEKAQKILKMGYVCDHCLGRQFAQITSGLSNDERGKIIRSMFAFEMDAGNSFDIKLSNFKDTKFRHAVIKHEEGKCWVCEGLFERIEELVEKLSKGIKDIEFSTFLVGTRPNSKLIENEEYLWENCGIEWVEPIKAEVNREIGKRLEKLWNKKADLKNPDVAFLIDLATGKINWTLNPIYIYGEYQKLKRGIPQTKWPSGKYKTSVEQIMAKPFMKFTSGTNHKLHGMGREDIDALCLMRRPFVLEILEPKKRNIDLNKMMKLVNKGPAVKIFNLKLVDSKIVEKVKSASPDKAYEALCISDKKLEKSDEKKIKKLIGDISQRTPERVLHRRGDLYRKRKVKEIKFKRVNSKSFKLYIKAEAGTYIKEFVSGDNGRTKPSVTGAISKQCKVKELNVVGIFLKEKIV